MPIEILMPALSPTMKEGNLVKWCKKEGDKVSSGELIAEIETDKATMELEACDDGILGRILVPEGSQAVLVNEVIAVIFEEGEDGTSYEPSKVELAVVTSSPTIHVGSLTRTQEPIQGDGPSERRNEDQKGLVERIKASPLARRIAQEKGLDLADISGSGPRGRIVRKDVVGHGQGSGQKRAQPGSSQSAFIEVPLSSMRKVIAQRLTESKQTVPHFYVSTDVIMDALLTTRAQINEMLAATGEKLSINDFFIKACALGLQAVPEANVSWHDTVIRQYRSSDISVAVSIDGGLITPIVREAQTKSLRELSADMKDLIKRARNNKLAPHEYQGGSFTISNMGMYDVSSFSAIINPPQSCILAIGASQEKVGVIHGEISKMSQVSLTLSVDHRAVDGAVAARFLQEVKKHIESPVRLLNI